MGGQRGQREPRGTNFQIEIVHGDLTHSMVAIINPNILQIRKVLRIEILSSLQDKRIL